MLEVMKLSPDVIIKKSECLDFSTTTATNETAQDYVTAKQQIFPNDNDKKKKIEDKFIEVQLKRTGAAESMTDLMIVGHSVGEVKEEGEEKKKKKRKKKKNKVSPAVANTEEKTEVKRPVKLEPIKNTEPVEDNTAKTEVHALKNVGCFGFISTWLAKRKEKRREKKRKAIQARKTKSVGSLVEYEHKQARGGVAFTLEMDNRPIQRSVLPPISQRPGPIRLSTEQKLECAENKRADHINRKTEAARAQSRLVQETADRRAENEYKFKQMTLQKIRAKEDSAFRATSRLEQTRNQRCQSRCISRMESTPNLFTSRLESNACAPIYEDDDQLSDCSIEGDIYCNVD